ncbi:ABC-three component system middle component 2 [Desulfobacter sp.]|uniref:ABC-three component system middle component 2 n=1 Tax=Desulfobacter sp. TaxID=2294 RepID=UPI00257E4A41|nr:ABC-three component system middle component 2 [Desulfobacter sp.]
MMNRYSRIALFNSPLETGIRSLAILVAAYPEAFDLERIVEMDYLVVHSGDADGPKSLHAALPMRAGELLVRRGLIENGLLLMASRNLIQRIPAEDGFDYIAGDAAAPFLSSLTATYSLRLKERALWAVERFTGVATSEIRQITHRLFENWSSQFQAIDRPRGNQ